MPVALITALSNDYNSAESLEVNVGLYGALIMAAGQDSDHLGQSCGKQPTRNGQNTDSHAASDHPEIKPRTLQAMHRLVFLHGAVCIAFTTPPCDGGGLGLSR